ncbi:MULTISPECIES: MarR family transcriptional regulator [Cohnella]|uniref:DNA-binding MarR family transcriptional regulator n=1 Tax=Cohnella phaseoli TaxID=456490 RepID=A0A3D9KRE3_9BACL|nr:MarR family transcriptional regulator [Cohnella phaseoli]RED89240.1 DNA-binding MarR family transcriptional regulator [Cohnella phaseoli]
MNKEERILMGVRDIYNKLNWLNKDKMEAALKGYTSSEVHCIEYVEKNADSNVTKLAEFFYMTRGAISKLTKKLMQKGLIESYQKSDNKKEIYFRLTERGKVVYKIHEDLHGEFHERDKAVFEQITEEQFGSMLDFLERYGKHLDAEIKKLGLEMKSE